MKQTWRDKHIVVIGAGKSGQALARYLSGQGACVTLSDQREAAQIDGLKSLSGSAIEYDLGGHNLALFRQADLIGVSPGVPLDCPPLLAAREAGVPLLSEVELAFRDLTGELVAITGTNGKSTTTRLIGEACFAWGKETFVGGNLGDPLILACNRPWQIVVAELSSFQLETVERFRPKVALLLNLSADHLDRYADIDSYYAAKMRIFENMSQTDFAVLNADDPAVCRLTTDISARKVWFSSAGKQVDGLRREKDRLYWSWQGQQAEFDLTDLRLSGAHNVENAMAALAAVLLLGCPAQSAWQGICAFTGLDHRMQLVRRCAGVDWYNDSKATNVGSLIKSLEGLPGPVVLIAGGKDKGGDYAPLRPLVEGRVSQLILIGQSAERIAEALKGCCPIQFARDLAGAVAQAANAATGGTQVLLSPACSSFDMFVSFEDRGRQFEQLVNALPEEGEAV